MNHMKLKTETVHTSLMISIASLHLFSSMKADAVDNLKQQDKIKQSTVTSFQHILKNIKTQVIYILKTTEYLGATTLEQFCPLSCIKD